MKKILSTILALAACTTLLAQDFKITHGPWLCDLTSDGVTVVWTTSKPALSWVEVAEDDGAASTPRNTNAATRPSPDANRPTKRCTAFA